MQTENEKTKINLLPVRETIELLSKDFDTVCDDSSQRFKEFNNLPPYYDEEKFKKGQQFYHKHIYGMFIGKLLGLLTVISTPTILKVLVFTNMSSDPLTAYKRYLATIFHMCVWYDNDFKPGSKLWQSINTVKFLHNSTSKRICLAKGCRILQKDMGITQFGFMGLAILRPEKLGIYHASKDELESFIHLWRVVGYIMGMEDRYNICRESLEETREICEGLIKNVFLENMKTPTKDYLKLSDALVTGMQVMNPFLETTVFTAYLHKILNINNNNNISSFPPLHLNVYQKMLLFFIEIYIICMQFSAWRIFSNYIQYMSFWLMKNFPFLALHRYGYENSYVSIYVERKQKRG
ncbi:hypothetical protein FQR65_LT06370 [Abscondita terminalis]|nr:hypothetical protein FQR65_LT06370 [Abscondita terminalis]